MSIYTSQANFIIDNGYLSEPQADTVSLDSMMADLVAKGSVYSGEITQDLLNQTSDPEITSNLGNLLALQDKSSTYSQNIGIIAVLVRKGVSSIDTILRN